MSYNHISEQGLLIFDCLAELLAGLNMRFSSIYRLDKDKVQIFFMAKLPGSKFFRILSGIQ